MVDETEVIKDKMEQTRSSLVNKIETLEQQVSATVQEATEVVSETVETVADAVDNTTEVVQSAVDTVKQTFDLSGHVEKAPWLMMGGAVLTGFVVKTLVSSTTSTPASRKPKEKPRPETATNGSSQSKPSGMSSLLEKPLNLARGLAVGSLFSVVRNVITQSLPNDWHKQLVGVVDDLNKQLGGVSLGESSEPQESSSTGDFHHAERNGSEMGRPMAAANRKSPQSVGSVHRR